MQLYDFQAKYLKSVRANWIYDLDCGTGKTYLALAHYRMYFYGFPIVVVGTASKLADQSWQKLIDTEFPDIHYKVCSYNLLAKNWKEYRRFFVIFDEVHRVSNSTGVWGKAAYWLSKTSAGFIGLSATPIPNGWEDAANYFKMFGLVENKTRYLAEYAYTSNIYGYQQITGWRNQDKLKVMWHNISKRLNKEDCLDLPDQTFETINFQASHSYKKILKTRMVLDIPLDNNMKLRHALRLYAGLHEKQNYLNDMLQDIPDNILIFYNYDDELECLKQACDNTGRTVYVCSGNEKRYPSKEMWSNVHNSVTLANYKAGAEGVEFTYCTVVIYFSPTESYAEYYQSQSRVHRIGQTRKVTYYNFKTLGTIEESIYEALNKKQDFNFNLWIEQKEKEQECTKI